MSDLLVYQGRALQIKGIDAETGALRVSGYLVVFSDEASPDLTGDYFTKATDFGALSDGAAVTLPAYFHHGLDSTIKTERIGRAELKMDDVGVFADYWIERRQAYLQKLVEAGHMGQSSGAVAHLVERAEGPEGKAWWLKAWPLGEASLTPEPAEPRTTAVPVKTLQNDGDTDAAVKVLNLLFAAPAVDLAGVNRLFA
jgi:phage head maturation protease